MARIGAGDLDLGQWFPALLALDEFRQDHDALAFDAAFDMGGVIGHQGNPAHRRAALGGKARTFDRQITSCSAQLPLPWQQPHC